VWPHVALYNTECCFISSCFVFLFVTVAAPCMCMEGKFSSRNLYVGLAVVFRLGRGNHGTTLVLHLVMSRKF